MHQLVILAAEEGGNGFLLGHDIKEVVVSALASLIVFALLWKFGAKPVKDAWNGRIDRISTEIDDAETARAEAEEARQDVHQRVVNLDEERNRILVEGRQTAEAVRAQVIERAESDAADIRARGQVDAEASKTQALADLQDEVAALAMGAAEAVVRNNLDDATQDQLIESYITQVGA